MMKQYHYWIVALGAVLAVCGACYFCFKPGLKVEPLVEQKAKKEAKVITVFVHGSLYPEESFLDTMSLSDLNTILYDTIEDSSEYVQSLRRVRANSNLYDDQIMLAEGLQEIHQSQIAQLSDKAQAKAKKGGCHHCSSCHQSSHAHHDSPALKDTYAAHYAVACYNSFMKRLSPCCDTAYYTFGHLGVLSHTYRANAAKVLYQDLLKIVRAAREDYQTVKVIVVAHSHGGTIALNLASAENEYKEGLVIDDLVLFGTPLQQETAPSASHPMFKRVMNCYSMGDVIQGSDVLTTASRKCYKTFSSFNAENPGSDKVYDVQLLVNDDEKAVNHSNMWYMQHEVKGKSSFEPLPYAVITPALIAALDERKFEPNIQAIIRSDKGHLEVAVRSLQETTKHYISPNTYDIVAQLRDHIAVNPTITHIQA